LQIQQKQLRDKILATDNYEELTPIEKARLAEEATRLPKVKSTINSHPKFLTKSHLLGFNKYTGGTFRYTPLDAQKIDGTKSQLFDIMHKKGFDN